MRCVKGRMCLLHFQLVASCLWSLYYRYFRCVHGPKQLADCFWFPHLTTEVDGWFDTLSRQCVKLQFAEMEKLPSLLSLTTFILSTFFGVKCWELSTWEEMEHILDRYELMFILNNYRWWRWWCQTSIWCSHAVFTHKFRISLSQG